MSVLSRTHRTLAAAALVAMTPAFASAQTALSVSVTVNTALSVSVAQALLFGTLTPGGTRTISASDETNAGIYDITGTPSASVNLSVTFPTCLKAAAGACAASDPAIDNNTSHWASAMASVHTALVGAGTLTGTGTIGTAGHLFVFVGSRVTIPAAAAAGTYSGTVTLTANY